VKLYWRSQLIKVHPHQSPGRRHTDPADLPSELSSYATGGPPASRFVRDSGDFSVRRPS
jgi:hypothetical protein